MDSEGDWWELRRRPIPALHRSISMSKQLPPNRSNVKNPNNAAQVADLTNRQNLGHGNIPPAPAPAVQQPVPPKK